MAHLAGSLLSGLFPFPLPSQPDACARAITAALERLDDFRDLMIAALDELDGDPDVEEQCEDEGAQCEGEGDNPFDEACTWPDEGDQTWRYDRAEVRT